MNDTKPLNHTAFRESWGERTHLVRKRPGILGLCVHIRKDGRIHNQGMVIGSDEDMAIIQRFSFLDCSATDVIAIPKGDLWDTGKCTVYACSDDMKDAYDEEQPAIF